MVFKTVSARVPRASWLLVSEISDSAEKITDQFKRRIPVKIVDTVAYIPGHANSTAMAGGATPNDRTYLLGECPWADDVGLAFLHKSSRISWSFCAVEWREETRPTPIM